MGKPESHLHFYVRHFPAGGEIPTDGTAKAVHGLAMGMAQCGRSVTVLCEGLVPGHVQSPYGYEIACFENKRTRLGPLSPELMSYLNLQGRQQNMVVVLNGTFNPSVYAIARFLKAHHIPYISSPHDPYCPMLFRRNAHLKWPYWYMRERQMLRSAQAVQVLDTRHGEWLRGLRVQTPVIQSPNGFFENEVPPESALAWRDTGEPRLAFMGRLDAFNKGLDLLIDAFAQIVKDVPATLALRGPDGGDGRQLRAMVESRGLGDRIHFPGADFSRTGPEILAEYDLFCLPSRFEGFGLAAVEAMLAARPVLVTDIAGIAPHVRASGCGLVVAPNVNAIREGIVNLLGSRGQWRELGLRGRHYALEHLQWKAIASETLGHYARLAS